MRFRVAFFLALVVTGVARADCYRLVAVDTVADTAFADFVVEAKQWRDVWSFSGGPKTWRCGRKRGELEIAMEVDIARGYATCAWTERGASRGRLEYRWSAPPELWCSAKDARMELAVKASRGGVYGGALFTQFPADRFAVAPGERNPFAEVIAGQFSGGLLAEQSGVASVAPHARLGGRRIVLSVFLKTADVGGFTVHYHYEKERGVGVAAEHRKVRVGEVVLVPLRLERAAELANADVVVTYDPAVVAPAGDAVAGAWLGDGLFSGNAKERGSVSLGFARATAGAAAGVVAVLPFRAVGVAGRVTPVSVAVARADDLAGKPIACEAAAGSVTVVEREKATGAQSALDMSVGSEPARMDRDFDKDGSVTSRDAAVRLRGK